MSGTILNQSVTAGTPTQVSGAVYDTVAASSGVTLTMSGFPIGAQSWSLAFELTNGEMVGVAVGNNGHTQYITPAPSGAALQLTGVSLSNGTLSFSVANNSSSSNIAQVTFGGMVL